MPGLISRFKSAMPRALNKLRRMASPGTAVRHRNRRMNEHPMKFILMNTK
ncbi:hypothetical protein [Paraburkholderia xenovorans]|nr:hypothetical protein [Paraburkholderia xenovorans]